MKYAVIFYSETGNTERLAEEIYMSIKSNEKVFINLKEDTAIPQADIYFIGFPIQKQSCSLKIIECLEQIELGKLVLFATCGMSPTINYKQKLEDSLMVWLPDNVDYLGMFLCQGKITDKQKQYFCQMKPEYAEQMKRMFAEGDKHPDWNDRNDAVEYINNILESIEEF